MPFDVFFEITPAAQPNTIFDLNVDIGNKKGKSGSGFVA
jgi:hypothetical protein